jgi:hypothetical protein
VAKNGIGSMRYAGLAEVVFCLLVSAGTLIAHGSGPGQAESTRSEAKKNGLPSGSKQVAEEALARQAVTVAQLTDAVEAAKDKNDEDAVREIAHLELSERLSSPELARLSAELPAARSKAALMAVGDASVFLEPPQGEMLNNAAPDMVEQRQIVSRASDYLKTIIPKLPDFYARRITKLFEEEWTAQDKKGTHNPRPLHLKRSSHATVLYRNGKEDVRAEGAERGGLITRGAFGPILSVVIIDNLRGPMQWHGWEKGPNGAMAVFQFQVPQKDSHYAVSFTMVGSLYGQTGYHGEIGIDPDTGAIMRLVLESDPVLGSGFIGHGDIMLEYGTVAIGGKAYTCPVRGVSMSTGRYRKGSRKTVAFILLDDVVFTDYHVFRSEMRILPN